MEKQLREKVGEISRNESFRGRGKLGDGPPTVGGDRLVLEGSPPGSSDVRVRHAREEPMLTHVGELFEQRHDQAAPPDSDQFARREESCLFDDLAQGRLFDRLARFGTTADRDPVVLALVDVAKEKQPFLLVDEEHAGADPQYRVGCYLIGPRFHGPHHAGCEAESLVDQCSVRSMSHA